MKPTKTRCLIVDDEPIAVRVIESHLEKIPDLEVVGTCHDAIAALELVRRLEVELIFLDINMPELSGVDFVRSLERPPKVIFTTAHREYAHEGFELDVVDYVLKPVSLPRLLKAIDKYRRFNTAFSGDHSNKGTRGGLSPQEAQYITVRANREKVKLRIDDILFIESLSDYTKFHTSGKPIITKRKISHLSVELADHGFIRIHRSFLVPISAITAYTSENVSLGDVVLPISRSYKHSVIARLES